MSGQIEEIVRKKTEKIEVTANVDDIDELRRAINEASLLRRDPNAAATE